MFVAEYRTNPALVGAANPVDREACARNDRETNPHRIFKPVGGKPVSASIGPIKIVTADQYGEGSAVGSRVGDEVIRAAFGLFQQHTVRPIQLELAIEIRGVGQNCSGLICSVDEGGCAGDVNTHGQQEQGGNDADAKFHVPPPLIIDLSLNRFSLGGFDTANKIKAAQKPCQKKPRLVRKSDRTIITKPND